MFSIGALDKSAIGLSVVCAVHCVALPIALFMLPSLAGLWFVDESFHVMLIFMVLPISIAAVYLGCKQHRSLRVFAFAFLGLVLLFLAVVLGHDRLGELGEKALTVVGAALLTVGHIKNFRSCLACR